MAVQFGPPWIRLRQIIRFVLFIYPPFQTLYITLNVLTRLSLKFKRPCNTTLCNHFQRNKTRQTQFHFLQKDLFKQQPQVSCSQLQPVKRRATNLWHSFHVKQGTWNFQSQWILPGWCSRTDSRTGRRPIPHILLISMCKQRVNRHHTAAWPSMKSSSRGLPHLPSPHHVAFTPSSDWRQPTGDCHLQFTFV